MIELFEISNFVREFVGNSPHGLMVIALLHNASI